MTQNTPASDLNIVDALVQLSFAVQTVLQRIASDHDVSLVQMRLFGVLRDREPEMMALARYLTLDKSSISGLVDRAERRGLVQRIQVPEDGRIFRVTLTDRGRQITAEIAAQVESEILELVSNLSEPDRKQIISLVSVMLTN